MIEDFLKKQKFLIQHYLLEFLSEKKRELSLVNPWGEDWILRLSDFVTRGKMIRGGLVIFSYQMFTEREDKEPLLVACALELFHSSFLIHDDIMDNDELRRGNPTIFAQYKDLGEKRKIKNADFFGKNMGICAGDSGFFLAFEILNNLKIYPFIKQKIIDLCAREFENTGLAQMQDVYLGGISEEIEEEKILSVYLYKTARYTFSLPLAIGATLAEQPKATIDKLMKLGEYLGQIFQIKDDELGIFGDEETIGKPIGSDIREGKKTLFYYYLLNKASGIDRGKLKKIWGNPAISSKDVAFIQSEIAELGVDKEIAKKVRELEFETKRVISALEVKKKYKELLLDILRFILIRSK